MKVNGMPMRGLDENIIDFIKNSDKAKGLREIFESIKNGNKEELFIGIRNNFITVYYRCLVVMEIRFHSDIIKNGYKPTSKTNRFNKPKLTKKYLKYTCLKDGDISSELICMNGIKRIKEGIEKYIDDPDKKSEKTEKKYQQNIVIVNNSKETKSKWICFDVEYTMADESFGRYDILAISTVPNEDGKYSIGLIEVKVDNGSYGTNKKDIEELLNNKNVLEVSQGEYKVELKSDLQQCKPKDSLGSGILGHFSDYIRYINDDDYMKKYSISRFNVTKNEVVNILKNYIELGLYHEKIKNFASLTVDGISDIPQFVFLSYANKMKIKSIKDSFRNYVLGTSDLAVTKVWDEKVIDQYRGSDSEIQFKCIFKEGFPEDEANRAIFSDVEISEAKNIFDEEAYK